jgi:hypothetical protein
MAKRKSTKHTFKIRFVLVAAVLDVCAEICNRIGGVMVSVLTSSAIYR